MIFGWRIQIQFCQIYCHLMLIYLLSSAPVLPSVSIEGETVVTELPALAHLIGCAHSQTKPQFSSTEVHSR